jgi:hypothetical protein
MMTIEKPSGSGKGYGFVSARPSAGLAAAVIGFVALPCDGRQPNETPFEEGRATYSPPGVIEPPPPIDGCTFPAADGREARL